MKQEILQLEKLKQLFINLEKNLLSGKIQRGNAGNASALLFVKSKSKYLTRLIELINTNKLTINDFDFNKVVHYFTNKRNTLTSIPKDIEVIINI